MAENAEGYVGIDSIRNDELVIQTVVAIKSEQKQYLQILYPVPVRVADLADSIEFAFVRFQETTFLRNSLKLSFSLVLSLVLLLSLLASIWVAFSYHSQYRCSCQRIGERYSSRCRRKL